MDFHCSDAGLFCDDGDRSTLVAEQPIELVSVSNLDGILYVRWPAEHRYHHLAALPKRMVDQPTPKAIRDWADHQGYSLENGKELLFADFLNQQLHQN